MDKKIWIELEEIMTSKKGNYYDKALVKLQPYLKICANNFHKKTITFGLMIPYEDFYSNSMLAVWEGLIAFNSNSLLNLKNVILYRINISEKQTWRQYKKRGTSSDVKETTYNSARWSILDFDCIDSCNIENDIVVRANFGRLLKEYSKKNQKGADIIKLLALGYSSHEAFKLVYNIDSYSSTERKKMERIKKKFKEFYYTESH